MKKILISIIISLLAVIGLLLVLDICDITRFIPLSKNYDWLSFGGAIIGGVLTFIGVYITIKNQNREEKERIRLSAMPLLEYKVSYDKKDFDNSEGQISGEIISHINLEGASYNDSKSLEWNFNLIISNIGAGHSIVKKIDLVFLDNDHKYIQDFNEGYVYKLIKQNESKSFKFLIYAPAERFVNQEFLYALEMTITYQDLLGNTYQQLLHCGIACSTIDYSTFADLSYYEPFKHIPYYKEQSQPSQPQPILTKIINSKIIFIPASDVKNIPDRYNEFFWNHHMNTHESYLELAKKSEILLKKWNQGLRYKDLKNDDECKEVFGAYLSEQQVIKVYKHIDGTYSLTGDGRHRVAAAQELNLCIPVKIIGEYKYPYDK